MNLTPPTTHAHFSIVPAKTRQAALAQFTHWTLKGAFSITQHQHRVMANYTWTQTGKRYTIDVHGALNLASLSISGQPGNVTLTTSKGEHLQAATPDALATQALGAYFPISQLRYWMVGLGSPTATNTQYDAVGHLVAQNQQGLQVRLSNYQSHGTLDLPGMINITGKHLRLRIVITT